jgi:hypothetical protein
MFFGNDPSSTTQIGVSAHGPVPREFRIGGGDFPGLRLSWQFSSLPEDFDLHKITKSATVPPQRPGVVEQVSAISPGIVVGWEVRSRKVRCCESDKGNAAEDA